MTKYAVHSNEVGPLHMGVKALWPKQAGYEGGF